MVLSRTAGYAISALAVLAAQPPEALCEAHRIAAAENIPRRFLSKILYALRRGGLLGAVRGTRGGYRLALRPDQISLVSVLETLGEKPEVNQCVLRFCDCSEETPCCLHEKLAGMRDEFMRLLETTTVADLVDPSSRAVWQPGSDRGRRVLR